MNIFVAISYHGFGHLAQAAPLINALARRHPHWQFVVQCAAPLAQLRNWIEPAFTHLQRATDLGIPMHNAVHVDVEETWRLYQHQHRARAEEIAACTQMLQQHKPDLVLLNTSYWIAHAAAQLQIPCFHFCSLNWADSFYAYCSDRAGAADIYQAICDDYNQGDVFFRLPPYMPMPHLQPLQDVGPVCRVGHQHDLHALFHHSPGTQHVLVTLGGLPYPVPYERWPRPDHIVYINAGPPVARQPHLMNVADTGLTHLDLVASCALVLTKPGYGTFLEAACTGTPVLYLPRGDWPEEAPLVAWQQRHGYCRAITEAQFLQGDLSTIIHATIQHATIHAASKPGVAVVTASGIDEILQRVEQRLGVLA